MEKPHPNRGAVMHTHSDHHVISDLQHETHTEVTKQSVLAVAVEVTVNTVIRTYHVYRDIMLTMNNLSVNKNLSIVLLHFNEMTGCKELQDHLLQSSVVSQ